jgi:hypothetical protein
VGQRPVFQVDDDLFEDGVQLGLIDDVEIVGEAANGEQAVALARQERPDVQSAPAARPGDRPRDRVNHPAISDLTVDGEAPTKRPPARLVNSCRIPSFTTWG